MINLTLARENTLAIARAKSRRPPSRAFSRLKLTRRWLVGGYNNPDDCVSRKRCIIDPTVKSHRQNCYNRVIEMKLCGQKIANELQSCSRCLSPRDPVDLRDTFTNEDPDVGNDRYTCTPFIVTRSLDNREISLLRQRSCTNACSCSSSCNFSPFVDDIVHVNERFIDRFISLLAISIVSRALVCLQRQDAA